MADLCLAIKAFSSDSISRINDIRLIVKDWLFLGKGVIARARLKTPIFTNYCHECAVYGCLRG